MTFEEEFPSLINGEYLCGDDCEFSRAEIKKHCLDKERVNQEIRAMKKEILDCWRDSTTDNFPMKLNAVLTRKLKRLGL